MRHVLQSQPFHGINRKVQLKPSKWAPRDAGDGPPGASNASDASDKSDASGPPTEALFILKWALLRARGTVGLGYG